MIEIAVIYWLAHRVGQIVKAKGRKPGWYQVMAVALWVVGEFLGGFLGEIIMMIVNGGETPSRWLIYLFALMGAAAGATAAHLIAQGVSPVAPPTPPAGEGNSSSNDGVGQSNLVSAADGQLNSRPSKRKRMNKKIVIGCLSAALLAVILAAVAVWFWLFRELPVLDASLSVPPVAALDSTVTMVITTTNTHTGPLTLDSIDIDDSFLTGFQVVGVHPKPKDTMHYLRRRSWAFGQSVAPGESLVVRFELRAVQEGRFSGNVEVYNPNQDFRTLLADVIVERDLPNKPSVGDVW